MEHAKKEHWEEFLLELRRDNHWDAAKLAKRGFSDGGLSRVPDLVIEEEGRKRTVSDNVGKAEAFKTVFFPTGPTESLVPEDATYPLEAWKFQLPADQQVFRAFKRMKPYKATRSDSLPNVLFRECADLIAPRFSPFLRATFTLAHYPEDWSTNETFVVRKPGKPDYQAPGAWRPLVLTSCWGCPSNSVISEITVKGAELHGLLPQLQFG
ncbi:hypothetical protein BT96DRAFT_832426, partial [Gymnopus androsaceus JB14]